MKENNLKKILSIVMSVAIIIIIIGTALAYFLPKITGEGKEVTAVSGSLSIEYTDGKEITAPNLIPGWTDTKTLTIKNTGDADVVYSLYWSCIVNELVRKNDLTYTITDKSNNTIVNAAFPSSSANNIIKSDLTIPKGETETYTVVITYLKTEEDQSSDMNKNFKGIIDVLPLGGTMQNTCPNGL